MANYNSNYTGQDLDKSIKLSKGSIAEEFSTSKSYAIGDLVIYDGDLYKCIVAHSGAWVAANFERINIAEAIEQGGKVTGVKGDAETDYRIGDVNLTPANIGLGNVDNTSDINKPISTATQSALDAKQDIIENLSYVELDLLQEKLTAGTGIEIYKDSEGKTIIGSTQTSAEWGNITGTLSNQTDLQNALDNKLNTSNVTSDVTTTVSLSTGEMNGFFVHTDSSNGDATINSDIVQMSYWNGIGSTYEENGVSITCDISTSGHDGGYAGITCERIGWEDSSTHIWMDPDNIRLQGNISGDNNIELIDNKVTSISSQSTDAQYPSAKCVYDNLINKQDKLTAGQGISIEDDSEGNHIISLSGSALAGIVVNITGDGSTTQFTVTHNLNTRDVMVQIYDLTTYDTVIADVIRDTLNTIKIDFKDAPASGKQFRVMISSFSTPVILENVNEEKF